MYTVRVNLDGLRSTDTLVYRATITTTEIENANSRESRRAFGFAVEVVEFRHPSRRPPETFDGALRPPFLMSCDSSNLINEHFLKKKKEGRRSRISLWTKGVGKIDTDTKTRYFSLLSLKISWKIRWKWRKNDFHVLPRTFFVCKDLY